MKATRARRQQHTDLGRGPRAFSLAACALLLLTGCIAPGNAPPGSNADGSRDGTGSDEPADCGSSTSAGGSGLPITVWVGNEAGETRCLELYVDSALVKVDQLGAGNPRLPAHYDTFWEGAADASAVTIKAIDTRRGVERTETFDLGDENHIVVSIYKDRIDLSHHETEPNFG